VTSHFMWFPSLSASEYFLVSCVTWVHCSLCAQVSSETYSNLEHSDLHLVLCMLIHELDPRAHTA
jgi:hypothetical protein